LSVDSPHMAQNIIICFAASCSLKGSSEVVIPHLRPEFSRKGFSLECARSAHSSNCDPSLTATAR
jgi:hypothetical protein